MAVKHAIKGFVSLLVLSTPLAASAATANAAAVFDAQQLTQTSPDIRVRSGEARINGVDIPAASISGFRNADDMLAGLQRSCRDRCTVTREATDMSEVFVVADVASTLCPRCRELTAATAEAIVTASYTISYINIGSETSLALGSPSGRLLAAILAGKPLSYEGALFKAGARSMAVLSQSHYRFEQSEADSLSGTVDAKPFAAHARFTADLRRAGYRQVTGSGAGDQEATRLGVDTARARSMWSKGPSLVQLDVTQVPNSSHSLVTVNSVKTP